MAHFSSRLALICAGILSALGGHAGAAEIHAGDGVEIRWDNTLRYSMAWRPLARSALGLSAGLRGNGMCLARSIVERYQWDPSSPAEDHELAWYDPSEVAFLVELG